jgi:hypothetical protein
LIFKTNINPNKWIYIELVGVIPLPARRQAGSKQKKETPSKTWSLFFVQLNGL